MVETNKCARYQWEYRTMVKYCDKKGLDVKD